VIHLPEPPTLVTPTTDVRVSYLVGEQADMVHRGSGTEWLAAASRDFATFVADRQGVRERWGVPSEVFWFVSGEYYLGSLVIRHRLIADQGGGHIGYHVVRPWQGRGHATAMLRQALVKAAELGISPALLTVAPGNHASRRVIEKCGGVFDRIDHDGERRYWVPTRAPSLAV
jgi:predicted acetyltransferase